MSDNIERLDREIHRTALALTATHYVHGASPCVRINSLKRGDRLYDAERERTFFAARRVEATS